MQKTNRLRLISRFYASLYATPTGVGGEGVNYSRRVENISNSASSPKTAKLKIRIRAQIIHSQNLLTC